MLQAVRLYTTAGILPREESLSVTQIHLRQFCQLLDKALRVVLVQVQVNIILAVVDILRPMAFQFGSICFAVRTDPFFLLEERLGDIRNTIENAAVILRRLLIHICDPFSCFDLSLLLRPACWRSSTVGQSTGVTSCQSDDRAIRRPNDLIFTDAL